MPLSLKFNWSSDLNLIREVQNSCVIITHYLNSWAFYVQMFVVHANGYDAHYFKNSLNCFIKN